MKPQRARDRRIGSAADRVEPEQRPAASSPTVEQMGEWSFPASDPPAVWTWDPLPTAMQEEEEGREAL